MIRDTRTDKLLPCPFCGGVAEIRERFSDTKDMIKVVCVDCGARSQGYPAELAGEKRAIAAWNRRIDNE